jgi:hypothetical protein
MRGTLCYFTNFVKWGIVWCRRREEIDMTNNPTQAVPPSHPNLGKYLADLVQHPSKGHALAQNPQQEMSNANLSDAEKDVLFRRDKNEMARVLAQHDPTLAGNSINIGTL